jgi:signal transduction histidine kinase
VSGEVAGGAAGICGAAAADVAFRAVFHAAPQALLAVDADRLVRLANAEAGRLLRRPPDDLVGHPVADLLAGTVPAAVAGEQAGELGLRLPDGRQVPVDVRAAPAGPDLPGWVVLAVDDPGERVRSRAALEHRVQRLTEAEQEQERLVGDLIRAQERERARIAAGVHDDSLQVITAAMLRVQQLRRRLTDPDALATLGRLEESIALAADRLRRLIFDFRPPALERAGLAAAVRDALARLRDDAGIEVRLANRLASEPPLPTRLLLYRITQEALANVGQHASAGLVEVTLADAEGGYLVRVADDGVGTAAGRRHHHPEPGHLGLVLMRERAEFAGGWFRLESGARSSGTTVTAWVPGGAT